MQYIRPFGAQNEFNPTGHAADPILLDLGLFGRFAPIGQFLLVVVSSIFVDSRVWGGFFVFLEVFGP